MAYFSFRADGLVLIDFADARAGPQGAAHSRVAKGHHDHRCDVRHHHENDVVPLVKEEMEITLLSISILYLSCGTYTKSWCEMDGNPSGQ